MAASEAIPLQRIRLPGAGTHLLMQVKINGLHANALVDTGASRSILDENRAAHYLDKAGSAESGYRLIGLGLEQLPSRVVQLEQLQLGGLLIENAELHLLDMQRVNQSYAMHDLPRLDMVLGGDILDRLSARICYATKRCLLMAANLGSKSRENISL